MSAQREFEGKDLEEALHAAAASLGIPEPELDYRIVVQGRRGLWGLGARSVRIRVMPPVEHLSDAAIRNGEHEPQHEPQSPAEAAPAVSSVDARPVESTFQRMLDLLQFELIASAGAVDGGVQIQLDGPDRRLLVQKDGELISAMEFLLNRMARRTWPGAGRIQLSCQGQQKGRDDDLTELTKEVAQQVARTGNPKRLHPMNAYERRLVHLTIRGLNGLGSRSEGDGNVKRVCIFPQKRSSKGRPRGGSRRRRSRQPKKTGNGPS